MKRLLLLATVLSAAAFAQDGFKPLFNGKTLDGWDGDPRLWSVVDGAIQGSTEGVTLNQNTFLISKRQYSDFVLRLEMKVRNHNSGVQFRSQAMPDWVVAGYQADAAANNYWGNIYDERGKRGTMVDGWKAGGQKAVKVGGWNQYEIRCQGDHIQIKLNGVTTADIHDTAATSGVIALQLHKGPAMQAWFRNIAIEELK